MTAGAAAATSASRPGAKPGDRSQEGERLERMTAQFRALHAVDLALTSSLHLDRVLGLILEKAVGLVGAEHGSLRLLSASGELELRSYLGEDWTPAARAQTFRIGQGITGWVAQQGRPYLCLDAHNDPLNIVLFEQMRSGVAVPLLASEAGPGPSPAVLGVLLLESSQPAAFDDQDAELLEALAQQAVIAIHNATQHQELQRLHRGLQDEQERRIAAEKWTVMGQTAAALAHRINNLIGVVPASAAEVRRTLVGVALDPTDREWVESNVGRIERNAQFVLRLTSALFRPFQESGHQAWFEVGRLLDDAVEAAGLGPGVEVVRDYAPGLPAVESSSLLVDVFLELMTNARRAMEGRLVKRLSLSTHCEEDAGGRRVVVQIGDSGRGIAPERMAHLWDMFKPSPDGLGFGLWWVKTFVDRQGGEIECQSRVGAGTTFRIVLEGSGEASRSAGGEECAARS